jgi:glycosyltransferase involved in cell wall biosynthesis
MRAGRLVAAALTKLIMHVLFIHQAFPAQFGRLALELTQRFGWKCSFLVEDLSNCPAPSQAMLQQLDIRQIPLPPAVQSNREVPWPQIYGQWLEHCHTTLESVRSRPDLRPDLVVAHGGRGPMALFLPEVLSCPIVNYCEYYFAASHRDISFRIDLPPAEPAQFFPRSINAPVLASLVAADAGYSPTHWQRESFPERYRRKIEVHFDGIDTQTYRPREVAPDRAAQLLGNRSLPSGTKIVTFVARGLESMRGFDIFMRVAQRIAQQRSDVLFVVVGSEETYYGWDKLHTGQPSFKQWVLSRGNYDLSRFVFLPHVLPENLAEILCLSDLHVYLSVPFVLSWSLLNAMACARVVLASDVSSVREFVDPGRTGLIEPLFDVDRLCDSALRVLRDPDEYRPLGQAARELIETRYSLDVAVPELRDYFESMSRGRGGGGGGAR